MERRMEPISVLDSIIPTKLELERPVQRGLRLKLWFRLRFRFRFRLWPRIRSRIRTILRTRLPKPIKLRIQPILEPINPSMELVQLACSIRRSVTNPIRFQLVERRLHPIRTRRTIQRQPILRRTSPTHPSRLRALTPKMLKKTKPCICRVSFYQLPFHHRSPPIRSIRKCFPSLYHRPKTDSISVAPITEYESRIDHNPSTSAPRCPSSASRVAQKSVSPK